MLLYYIRHGDPIYDPDSLTPLGHQQAEALAERLCLYGFDEIYASTSTRAIMTAEPTCKRLGKTPILLDWANEGRAWDFFSVKNKTDSYSWVFSNQEWIKKFNDPEVFKLGDEWYKHPYFENTNFEKGTHFFHDNVDNLLQQHGFKHDRANHRYEVLHKGDKRIAIFAHQGMGMSVLSSIMDIPYPYFCTHFDTTHTGVTVIEFPENTQYVYPKMLQLSNDSHLFKAGLMDGYHGTMKI